MSVQSQPHRGMRSLRALVVGILLYGGANALTYVFKVDVSNIQFRPGVAVPIMFGFIYGPLVGFGVGMFGNILGDFLSNSFANNPVATGALVVDVVRQYNLHWQLGNGVIGLLPGLLAWRRPQYRTGRDLLLALGVAALGIIVGMSLAEGGDLLLGGQSLPETLESTRVVVGTNLLTTVLLVPLLLYNYAHLDHRAIPWRTSGILRQLLLAVGIAAGLPVLLLGLVVAQQLGRQSASSSGLVLNLLATVVLTLLVTIANAALLAQQIIRPILRLTDAAQHIEADTLSRAEADELAAVPGKDELARLSQLFGRMAREVVQREAAMQQRIANLQIEIDVAKRNKQVAEVTETEYFRDLQQRARNLRQRGASSPVADPAPEA